MIQTHAGLTPPLAAYRPHAAPQVASDRTLIARIAGGDIVAYKALYARHNVGVFRFVLRKVKNHALADDLVGETFFEVWRNADRFEARAEVATWLLAIARHKALTALRRLKACESIDDALTIADAADDPEVAAQKKDRDAVLRGCLMKLSGNHREIIDLVYYHEQSIDAVAKIVGIPLSTVKTRMFYARKRLAALLLEAGIDRGAV
jgi:RNA polymerase sigma-70 factor (ECF subfamily)